MADINVQRRRISIWPWILGLLAVAILIWVLAEMLGGDGTGTSGAVDDVGVQQVSPPPIAAGLRVT